MIVRSLSSEANRKLLIRADREERGGGDRGRGGEDKGRGGDDRRGRYGRYGRGEESSSESSSRDSGSSRGTTSSDKNTKSSSTSSSYDAQASRLAKSKAYVEKYFADRDTDNNGILEGDELNKVRSKSKYDTNRDGKIEVDEMLEVIAPQSTSSASSSSKSATRRSSSTSSRSRSKASGSFTDADVNADRLVQRHEFSEIWTKKQLDEFLAKDKNGDGVISPDEW